MTRAVTSDAAMAAADEAGIDVDGFACAAPTPRAPSVSRAVGEMLASLSVADGGCVTTGNDTAAAAAVKETVARPTLLLVAVAVLAVALGGAIEKASLGEGAPLALMETLPVCTATLKDGAAAPERDALLLLVTLTLRLPLTATNDDALLVLVEVRLGETVAEEEWEVETEAHGPHVTARMR